MSFVIKGTKLNYEVIREIPHHATFREKEHTINSTVTESHSIPCLFGCNFIFYPQNHKNKILLNGILPDHYTLRISTELAYGKYLFLVLKVALRNHINFDAYFEPLSNNYKTL